MVIPIIQLQTCASVKPQTIIVEDGWFIRMIMTRLVHTFPNLTHQTLYKFNKEIELEPTEWDTATLPLFYNILSFTFVFFSWRIILEVHDFIVLHRANLHISSLIDFCIFYGCCGSSNSPNRTSLIETVWNSWFVINPNVLLDLISYGILS